MKRQYAVLGLGTFGYSTACTMAEEGYDVLAADFQEDAVNRIAPFVTRAVQADLANEAALRELGLEGLDGVVICLSENLEASVVATVVAKECGVPHVLVKVQNELQEMVLRKVGADEVVFPERSMGVRVARSMIAGRFVDMIELTKHVSMAEVIVPGEWAGRSLLDLDLRKKGISVIGRQIGEELMMQLDPAQPLVPGDKYIVVGDTGVLESLI